MVVAVEQRTAQLRRLDDHMGGGDLLGIVTAELGATVTLAREASYTEATGRRLFAGIGDLAQLAGALDKAARAHRGAERLWTVLGPTNVAIHRSTTLVELGHPGRALRAAEQVDVAIRGAAVDASPGAGAGVHPAA